MKFSITTLLIVGGFVADVTARDQVWAKDGQCQWLYQRVVPASGTKSSKGNPPPPPVTTQGAPNLICADMRRRRYDRQRRLKGGDTVYTYVEFDAECGCMHTEDGYSCVEEKLDTHEVMVMDCDSTRDNQLWVMVPLTQPYTGMVLFENHATRRCMKRNANPDGQNMFTEPCNIYDELQMFKEPAAEKFYLF